MKTRNFLITMVLIVLSLFITNHSYSKTVSNKSAGINQNSMVMSPGMTAADLRTAMRQLWEDHIVWTRNVILCLADDLPGTDQAVARLMKNQEDIGNAIKPFYGDDAGTKLTGLLKQHIAIAADVVNAAKKGDNTALADADKRWHANADEISSFLSNANPNLKLADMKNMMNEHLKLTTDEAVARLQKKYDADIAAYDSVHKEILMMADNLTDAIVKQFPAKFTGHSAYNQDKTN